jgi:flagellar basal body P-ring formation protein FlgA
MRVISPRPLPPASCTEARRGRPGWAASLGVAFAIAASTASAGERGFTPASVARATTSIRIELRPAAEVDHAEVTVGDVAVITTGDLQMLQRLVDLPIGPAPRTDAAVRIDRRRLMRWIRSRTGVESSQIVWTGPSTTVVRRAMREISGQAVARAAEERLRAALASDQRRLVLHVRQIPRALAAPAGPLRLEARPVPPTEVVPRRLTVWVDVWVDDRFVRTVPVGFDVGVFGPAYVATRGHAAGQILAPAELAIREVEWSGRDAPLLDPGAPDTSKPLRLRRRVAAGEPLTRAETEQAPAVARGEWAVLRATQGSVQLETRVEVLQDGRSGQAVRVRLPSGHDVILARVTGPGAVEMQP